MATRVGAIRIDLGANTAQFEEGMNRANRTLSDFGSHGVNSIQATSAALRVMEGNVQNNIRAAERFLAQTLGLGDALKAAFPVVGAIALGGVLSELITKATEAYEAFKKMEEAPARIADGFRNLNTTLSVSNDQLRVTNDRLAMEIAKLEGKPSNGLQLGIDEARQAADKLAESLAKDIDQVQKLLKEETIGTLKGLFTGRAPTSDIEKAFFGEDGYSGFRGKINDITSVFSEQLATVTDKTGVANLRSWERNLLEKAYGDQIGYVQRQLEAADTAQRKRATIVDKPIAVDEFGRVTSTAKAPLGGPDQAARIAELQGLLRQLRLELESVGLEYQNVDLQKRKADLEGAKVQPKTQTDYYGDRLAALQAQLSGSKQEAAAAGDAFREALAEGAARATRDIQELNKELAKNKESLTLGQQAAITSLDTQVALTDLLKRTTEAKAAADKHSVEESVKAFDAEDAAARKREQTAEERQAKETARIEKERGELAALQYQLDAVFGSREDKFQAQLQGIRGKGREEGTPQADIDDQIAKATKAHQLELAQLGVGETASQGFKQFFEDMKDNAVSAGVVVKEALGGAFKGVNDQLAAMLSGQKTSWASFFQSLGSQLLKLALGNLESQIFGSLFKNGGGGGWGGFLSGLVGVFGGKRAEGSSVDPGKTYLVGESGPELWTPSSMGSITPNNKLGMGTAVYYNIDARGTDPVLTEQRTRSAIIAAHQSAVVTSIRSEREREQRVPPSRR
jgi:hypothetical protein